MVLRIHGKVEEIIGPCEAVAVDFLQEPSLRVLVWDVAQHQGGHRILNQGFQPTTTEVCFLRHAGSMVWLESSPPCHVLVAFLVHCRLLFLWSFVHCHLSQVCAVSAKATRLESC